MTDSSNDDAATDRCVDAVVFDMDGVLVESETYWTEEMRDIIDVAYPPGADVTRTDLTGISVTDGAETEVAEGGKGEVRE